MDQARLSVSKRFKRIVEKPRDVKGIPANPREFKGFNQLWNYQLAEVGR
ncbi:hypothetical protein [Insulibacter thermoxylanivorax]|nr:hypothetical protein [Insulibacter thermoxylanivorax]